MILSAILVLGQTLRLPSDSELKQTNSEILSFVTRTFGEISPSVKPANWPAEFDDPQTYWLGERPLMSWTPEARRFVLDRFVDQAKTDPAIREWLLSDGAMENAKLRVDLTFQPEWYTLNSRVVIAMQLLSHESYQYDYHAWASFASSLSEAQISKIERNYMRLPISDLSQRQMDLLKACHIPTPPTVTPTPPDKPQLVFDYYYQAYIETGKQSFHIGLARSTEPLR